MIRSFFELIGSCLGRGIVRVIALIVGCGLTALIISIFPRLNDDAEQSSVRPYKASSYEVIYGCAGGNPLTDGTSITWINGDHETEIGDYQVPFSVTYTMHLGDHAQITARPIGNFQLNCAIHIDGYDWIFCKNLGEGELVNCSGTVGRK